MLDDTTAADGLAEYPPWIQERLTGPPIMASLDPDDPGEPPRRPNGQKVFDHLRAPDRLADMIRAYWRERGFEVDVRVARIGEGRDFAITSNLGTNGLPRENRRAT